jgi:outer membrane PBP1 activator LpoA protein
MKKISFALVGAASLALAACGGQGDDTLGENVQENMEAAAENLEEQADNAAGAEAANLENQADQLREAGENAEEAIDEADVNASEVNAM